MCRWKREDTHRRILLTDIVYTPPTRLKEVPVYVPEPKEYLSINIGYNTTATGRRTIYTVPSGYKARLVESFMMFVEADAPKANVYLDNDIIWSYTGAAQYICVTPQIWQENSAPFIMRDIALETTSANPRLLTFFALIILEKRN